ncbi:hypothetical protein [Terrabacter carboxydivorans]|uniref:Uncharacterized protein n=1 Tax=Terrabacter carboxydivorans TaxID=619730 RepID=A0ABN3KM99_9MICO
MRGTARVTARGWVRATARVTARGVGSLAEPAAVRGVERRRAYAGTLAPRDTRPVADAAHDHRPRSLKG